MCTQPGTRTLVEWSMSGSIGHCRSALNTLPVRASPKHEVMPNQWMPALHEGVNLHGATASAALASCARGWTARHFAQSGW